MYFIFPQPLFPHFSIRIEFFSTPDFRSPWFSTSCHFFPPPPWRFYLQRFSLQNYSLHTYGNVLLYLPRTTTLPSPGRLRSFIPPPSLPKARSAALCFPPNHYFPCIHLLCFFFSPESLSPYKPIFLCFSPEPLSIADATCTFERPKLPLPILISFPVYFSRTPLSIKLFILGFFSPEPLSIVYHIQGFLNSPNFHFPFLSPSLFISPESNSP